MIALMFSCDGACDTEASVQRTGAMRPEGWLAVYPPAGGPLHFCSWDCVRSYILHHEGTTCP